LEPQQGDYSSQTTLVMVSLPNHLPDAGNALTTDPPVISSRYREILRLHPRAADSAQEDSRWCGFFGFPVEFADFGILLHPAHPDSNLFCLSKIVHTCKGLRVGLFLILNS